jgi:hypothetical protein
MKNKYGVFQSSPTSCVFYKQDKDGNQSTFNVFVDPSADTEDKRAIFAFIDNEQLQQKSWFKTNELTVDDIAQAFKEWASDAPFLFGMDAQKSINQCLSRELKTTKFQ